METTKKIIWTSDINLDDWREDIKEWYPDEELTEDEIWNIAQENNDCYLEDEIFNLRKELGNNIVVLADLGLWNGRRRAWKVLNGTNLNNIFSETEGDYVTWYVDGEEVKCDDTHHDGTNHYTYRVIKDGIDRFEFEEAMYDGKDVDEMTDKLGHYVAEIYGW